jgi:hypothetical protein
MQKTINGLEEFSSEKVLEFIGGVDDHMDDVSKQLRQTLSDFNTKLDDLNEAMGFFMDTMVNLK